MLSLMRLETRKIILKKYILAAVIANLVILAFIFLMIVTDENISIFPEDLREEMVISELMDSLSMGFDMIDALVKTVFGIFASVLIARFIIDEYKNKTISVLFMYPISRKKLIWAKLLIILVFTVSAIFLSDIFLAIVFTLLNEWMHFLPDTITWQLAGQALAKFGINAIAFSGVSFIPLYFGMRKKSVPATILSSVILLAILCSSNGGFSLISIIYIPIALTLIGFSIAYLSFKDIEKQDVIC